MDNTETSQIASTLRAFIRDKFKVPDHDADFSDDVHLFNYGYIDSFGAVELSRFVELSFGIELTESDLVAFPLNTINEITTFVTKRKHGEI